MALRSEIVKWAIWESDFGEWKPSAEEMQKFFRTVGLDPPTCGHEEIPDLGGRTCR